ncbi:peptide arylation enzyme [Variovorax sp. WS11]|uniref:AMP-binding protein n=1 Tax=Variovorax sp. WS11 TaxID=1105204 RepID=UPI000D0CD036|nr:AMP-binding protein [Variovorax sp. WS11]NDZ18016.1 (2,3-dihydroxybenzoyl)adenylate synthase [Variovorax sp. WS11]PSL80100.1 peptide arylation enzyme [Variovorax sp. WS11]
MIGVKVPIPGVIYPPVERLKRYVEGGELELETLVDALSASFSANAGRTALATDEGDVSYAQLDDITDRFAGALLGLGLEPLDRVLFQCGNCKELVYAVVGCLKAGLIPVCTLAVHREHEIVYLGCHTEARVHIVQGNDPKFDLIDFALKVRPRIPTVHHVISIGGEGKAGVLRFDDLVSAQERGSARESLRSVPRDPFQVAVFQLSGGTSGVPKVIPRMHNDYLLNARLTIDVLGYAVDDVLFMPMPMIHNASMICFWLPCLLAGASFTIPRDLTPEAWGRIFREKKPTFIGLIRPLLPRLEEMLQKDYGSLERVRGSWSPDGARLVREKYGIPSLAMFGMTEGMNLYCREGDPDEALDWTIGRPLSRFDEIRLVEPGGDREVALGEVGELTCRGPYTLSGYYNAPERNQQAFTEDGFYRSGDLLVERMIGGRRYYAFAGRTKDVIDRGNEKVNCEEVENAASTHPAVSGCAVVGMPDAVLGERICAFLVIKEGECAPSVVELGRHFEVLGLAKFKWPERIEVIEALPVTKVNKLDKAVLRSAIRAKLAEEQIAQAAWAAGVNAA